MIEAVGDIGGVVNIEFGRAVDEFVMAGVVNDFVAAIGLEIADQLWVGSNFVVAELCSFGGDEKAFGIAVGQTHIAADVGNGGEGHGQPAIEERPIQPLEALN